MVSLREGLKKKASAATAAMLVNAGRLNKATRPADPLYFVFFFAG